MTIEETRNQHRKDIEESIIADNIIKPVQSDGDLISAGWILKTGHGTQFSHDKPKAQVDLWQQVFQLRAGRAK